MKLATLAMALVLAFPALVHGAGENPAYIETAVRGGGGIRGVVRFAGAPPRLKRIFVGKNQEYCGNSAPSEALIVSKDGGVKYAVAYLDNVTAGKPVDRNAPALLTESKCAFVPHVFAIVEGNGIQIKNEDPILHNVNISVEGAQRYNRGQPIQNQVLFRRLKWTGVAEITCDAHTHMRSYALVLGNPYFAVSDETGAFEISDIPPGAYTLKVWHESWLVRGDDDDGRPTYGPAILLSKEVTVRRGATERVEFEINP